MSSHPLFFTLTPLDSFLPPKSIAFLPSDRFEVQLGGAKNVEYLRPLPSPSSPTFFFKQQPLEAKHAVFSFSGYGTVELIHLHAKDTTLLNDRPISISERVAVQNGDIIKLGFYEAWDSRTEMVLDIHVHLQEFPASASLTPIGAGSLNFIPAPLSVFRQLHETIATVETLAKELEATRRELQDATAARVFTPPQPPRPYDALLTSLRAQSTATAHASQDTTPTSSTSVLTSVLRSQSSSDSLVPASASLPCEASLSCDSLSTTPQLRAIESSVQSSAAFTAPPRTSAPTSILGSAVSVAPPRTSVSTSGLHLKASSCSYTAAPTPLPAPSSSPQTSSDYDPSTTECNIVQPLDSHAAELIAIGHTSSPVSSAPRTVVSSPVTSAFDDFTFVDENEPKTDIAARKDMTATSFDGSPLGSRPHQGPHPLCLSPASVALQRVGYAWMAAWRDVQRVRRMHSVDTALCRLRSMFEELCVDPTSSFTTTHFPPTHLKRPSPSECESAARVTQAPTTVSNLHHRPHVVPSAILRPFDRDEQPTPAAPRPLVPHAPFTLASAALLCTPLVSASPYSHLFFSSYPSLLPSTPTSAFILTPPLILFHAQPGR